MYGEITRESMDKVLRAMHAAAVFTASSVFVDVGSGVGKPNLHAAVMPLASIAASVGIEHGSSRFLLSMAALRRAMKDVPTLRERANATFVQRDVTDVHSFSPATHVYSFNVGMPAAVNAHIVQAFLASASARVLCVYGLSERDADHATLRLVEKVAVSMTGSGERKTAGVYVKAGIDSGEYGDEEDAGLVRAVELCRQRSPSALFARAVRARCNDDALPWDEATLAYLRELGVDANRALWCPLCVQAVCWGVPLWVLRAAGKLGPDGLPAPPDPMHWALRVWPLLRAASPDDCAAALLTKDDAAPPGLSLRHFWDTPRSTQCAERVLGNQPAHALPVDKSVYISVLRHVPHNLSCPDVPMPWSERTSLANRVTAWRWLHTAVTRAAVPPSMISTTPRGQQAFTLNACQHVAVLAALWHPEQNESHVCAENKALGVSVTYENVRTLSKHGWLDNGIIDAYLRILQPAVAPDVLFTRCQLSFEMERVYTYADVRGMVPRDKLRAARRVVCPLHVNQSHWALCVLDKDARKAVYVDSMYDMDDAPPVVHNVTQFVDDHGDGARPGAPWTVEVRSERPTQNNSKDCGVFVLQFAAAEALRQWPAVHGVARRNYTAYLRLRTALACFAVGVSGKTRAGEWRRYLWPTQPAPQLRGAEEVAAAAAARGAGV